MLRRTGKDKEKKREKLCGKPLKHHAELKIIIDAIKALIMIAQFCNCRIAHILGILLMNSCNTDIFLSNYYHWQSVRFELQFTLFIVCFKILCFQRNIAPGVSTKVSYGQFTAAYQASCHCLFSFVFQFLRFLKIINGSNTLPSSKTVFMGQ